MGFVEHACPERLAEVGVFALGGLRPSEAYALTWADVDLEQRTVTISKSVDRGHVDAPKVERSNRQNISGRRVQVLPAQVMDALREHRKRLMEHNHPGLKMNLVFPSNKGTHRMAGSLSKLFRLAETYLGWDIRVGCQVLRRTYNTIMKDLTDMTTLHAMIGHADEKMTELYSHIGYDKKVHAVTALERCLKEADHA